MNALNFLDGKIAVVTGGARGIGAAIAQRLAEAGARVVIGDLDEEAGKKTALAINQSAASAQFGQAHFLKLDVTDPASVDFFVKMIKLERGPIDILVNNAGITRDAPLRKMTEVQWDQVMTTNLKSLYNMTKPIVEDMATRGWGRIINISSVNGVKGQFGQANYSAAKAGALGFTMSLALEVASKGVTVNAIAPGYVSTEMVMAIREDIRTKIVSQIPVGRLGAPEEIAELVAYLASPLAGFMTGATLNINGGMHMC